MTTVIVFRTTNYIKNYAILVYSDKMYFKVKAFNGRWYRDPHPDENTLKPCVLKLKIGI